MEDPDPFRWKNNHHKPTRTYRYNPYEFAVCGPTGAGKTTWLSKLAHTMAGEVGITLIDLNETLTDPLAPYAWLAADAVLVESQQSNGLPYLFLLDEKLTAFDDPDFRASSPAAVIHPFVPGSTLERQMQNAIRSIHKSVLWFHRDDMAGIRAFVLDYWRRRTSPLAGLLLTGGRSSRMGQDKALLDYHGLTQLEHTMALLARQCPTAFISCRPDQIEEPHRSRFPLLPDRFLGMGPVGGILSALGKSDQPQNAWLVLACDLPHVTQDLLRMLVASRNPFRFATAFRGRDGFPEPLCAIWEPKSYPRLLQFAGLAYECPRKLLMNSPICMLLPPDPNSLDNGNDLSDFERIRHDLHRGS